MPTSLSGHYLVQTTENCLGSNSGQSELSPSRLKHGPETLLGPDPDIGVKWFLFPGSGLVGWDGTPLMTSVVHMCVSQSKCAATSVFLDWTRRGNQLHMYFHKHQIRSQSLVEEQHLGCLQVCMSHKCTRTMTGSQSSSSTEAIFTLERNTKISLRFTCILWDHFDLFWGD